MSRKRGEDVGAAGLVGDDDVPMIAHQFGHDMLVAARVLLHRRDVQAALVRERRLADVRRVADRRAVQPLVEQARHVRKPGQIDRRQPGLEAHLQLQGRDDGDQVGVAAALAEAVQRALHLASAGAHRQQAVGDRVAGVVVTVDAERIAGHLLGHLGYGRLDLMRQVPPLVSHRTTQRAPAS